MIVVLRNNAYMVRFPYDPILLDLFKSCIPAIGRKWDPESKQWSVDAQYRGALARVFPNESIPAAPQARAIVETRMLDMRYLGQVKDRGNNTYTAFGYVNQQWSVIFTEKALRSWFELITDDAPRQNTTLYGVLGISRTATGDEIKSAYRRMARQWHPDVCHEANANEVFLRIKEAHTILSNVGQRARYDVGLTFESGMKKEPQKIDSDGYRAPLRCGLILAEGQESLGRFVVSRILEWLDITNAQGQTLVSSWVMGADRPDEVWA